MPLVELQPFAEQIKATREARGLSQRALSERVGIPQSHLSRIENGSVDLQVSTLIQIARALDLETVMIPRNALSALAAVGQLPPDNESPDAARTRRVINSLRLQANQLARRFPQASVLKRLSRTLLELRDRPFEGAYPINLVPSSIATIGQVFRDMSLPAGPTPELLKQAETVERAIRLFVDSLTANTGRAQSTAQTPAYTLDDNDPDHG